MTDELIEELKDEIESESMDECLKKIVYEKGLKERVDDMPIDSTKVKKKKKKGHVKVTLQELGKLLNIQKPPRQFNPRGPPLTS